MGFNFLVWNVEKFKATNTTRIRTVADHIKNQNPDVFSILEFSGKSSAQNPSQKKDAARRLISQFLPEYDFGLTDSKRRLELLTGWKRGVFDQVLFTQRREFDASNPNLWPGGLLSVREVGASAFHNFLFLHTDSGRKKTDFGQSTNDVQEDLETQQSPPEPADTRRERSLRGPRRSEHDGEAFRWKSAVDPC